MFCADKYLEKSNEPLIGISPEEFIDLVEPKLEYDLSLDHIKTRLDNNEKLNVKMGIDPTGPDVHIGHIVPIRVLDLFSRAGHKIDLIFGDFTAKIGDPSGRDGARKVLSDDEIVTNVTSYRGQVDNFFNTSGENVHIHRNSTWLGQMALHETFGYLQMVNLSEATQRKDFRERIQKGSAVTLAEAMYATLQGIDSVYLESDVEIGGIDQLLNVQQARNVQRKRGQKPEDILLTPIIEGTSGDGRKMSKSYNNYIPTTSGPDDIFGKIMSIPDTLIVPYAIAFAPVSKQEIKGLTTAAQCKPLETKKQLATYLAATSAGSLEQGELAKENFERRFSRKVLRGDDLTEITVSSEDTIFSALVSSGGFKSNSEIRRLASGGGIKLNGQKITEDELLLLVDNGHTILVGKRQGFRIRFSKDES
ncbi:tyrosine--tRNA ligase [Candidatus Saccharibacteria bacterium]|nr:tyrosine--tRNA ligase [Candidatus Saccharibacteria bacterium]